MRDVKPAELIFISFTLLHGKAGRYLHLLKLNSCKSVAKGAIQLLLVLYSGLGSFSENIQLKTKDKYNIINHFSHYI